MLQPSRLMKGHCIIRMDPAKLKRVKTQGSRSITTPSGSILGRLPQIKQLFAQENDDPHLLKIQVNSGSPTILIYDTKTKEYRLISDSGSKLKR